MRTNRPFRLPLLALALTVSLVGACSSGSSAKLDSSASSGSTSKSSSDSGTKPASAQKHVADAVSVNGKLRKFSFDLQGSVDIVASHQKFGIQGSRDADANQYQIKAKTGTGSTTQVRVKGQRAWVSSDVSQFKSAMPSGKTWLTGPLSTFTDSGVVTSLDKPIALIYLLNGAHNVKSDGSADVNGTSTHRYRFGIDLAKAKAAAPADRRAEVAKLMTNSGQTKLVVTGEVWLDSKDRIVKFTADGALMRAGAHATDTATATDESGGSSAVGNKVGSIGYVFTQTGIGRSATVAEPSAADTVSVEQAPGVLSVLTGSTSDSASS